MATYSVADAKARLPRLINKAIAGEESSRHGKPVAELRPAAAASAAAGQITYDELRAGRVKPRGPAPTSVELLNLIYDEPPS